MKSNRSAIKTVRLSMETNAFPRSQTPRREFLTTTTKAVAATTLLSGLTHSINSSPVHAAGSDSINIALIGCGGRAWHD